jgi:puromycin-sensitive aminopeptidase
MTDPYRLPRVVTPDHYELTIAPDLATCRFEGTTVIQVTVAEPVTDIVLNAIELELHSAVVAAADGQIQEGAIALDEELGRATLTFPSVIPAGTATLTIASTGTINDQLRGFYRSTFTDADGTERLIATTQFESTDARRAFPCWDEPEHKATFQVRLLVPDGLLGLSNTAVVDERKADGGTWVTFGRTMKMSTYLVAFIVGPLVTTAPRDVDGVPLRVACIPGREHLAEFALEAGAHALRFLAGYFAIPYPSDKLDLIALPDFAFGAMENLGCVTFRETALLVDQDNSSRLELERVADVVSHEIAHMWFGDLVTMKWWNGIWLNEAFATFMELTTVDAFRPTWDRWIGFSTERAAAMTTDALASTRPIEYEVVSPAEAEGMFDVLTYQKGGAVLRMLEQYLGAERFRDGIRLYLDRHRYANTETTDLWDAIEEATGEPVRSIMDSWILQGGHPVVTVEQTGNAVALSQRRFRFIPDDGDTGVRWEVPILYRTASGEHDRILLSDASTTLSVTGTGPVIVNDGGWGVFRTSYTATLLSEVAARLPEFGPLERFNLVGDTWATVLAGAASVGEFIDLVGMLGGERNPSVWEAAIDGLGSIYREIPEGQRDALSAWVRSLMQPIFDELGWAPSPGEDDGTSRLRAILLLALGTIGDDRAIQAEAHRLHAEGAPIPPDLLAPIVSVVAWNGDRDDYELFWQRIRGASTPQEEVRYLFRLAAFPDPELLEQTLAATLEEIRSQNGAFVIASCVANRRGGRQAWAWLVEHWDDALKRLPGNTHGRMLEGIVRLTDPESVTDVAAFLADHPIPNARKQIDQLLERQRVYAAWAERSRPELAQRFS